MKKQSISTLWLLGVFTVGLICTVDGAAYISEEDAMLSSLIRMRMNQQVTEEAAKLASSMDSARASQVKVHMTAWARRQKEDIRLNLENWMADQARERFKNFVSTYTRAEKEQNEAFLQQLAEAVKMDQVDAYEELRSLIMEQRLGREMEKAGVLLTEIDAWREAADAGQTDTSLNEWLDAGGAQGAIKKRARAAASEPSARAAPVDPFMAAEADIPAWNVEAAEESGSPMDTYSELRDQKREKMLEEAHAGMELVAKERAAAEEEFASKKLAAAEKEAEAMRRQAEKMASVEKMALEQRQRTWGARIKRIVGSTLSAAGGAFFGGVGSQAGEEAANALFD